MGFVDAFGDPSIVPPYRWVPEPTHRGTWSVVSPCLITLLLSLWAALHLNLPEHGKASAQAWRKLRWLFIGLLAPEMVAYSAWAQSTAVKTFTRQMRDALGLEPELSLMRRLLKIFSWYSTSTKVHNAYEATPGDPDLEQSDTKKAPIEHNWTVVHSFLAFMGGFAFDIGQSELNFLPGERTRLCIHPEGLLYIARTAPHLLPNLGISTIKDKSKASSLAKTLVCAQAIWCCSQCIFRLSQATAVSLLEIDAFCHALCALLIYGLWLYKPLDIDEPFLLEGPEARQMCAFMCMASSSKDSATDLAVRLSSTDFLFEDAQRLPTWRPEFQGGPRFGEVHLVGWKDLLSGQFRQHLNYITRFSPRFHLKSPEGSFNSVEPSFSLEKVVATRGAVQLRDRCIVFGLKCRVGPMRLHHSQYAELRPSLSIFNPGREVNFAKAEEYEITESASYQSSEYRYSPDLKSGCSSLDKTSHLQSYSPPTNYDPFDNPLYSDNFVQTDDRTSLLLPESITLNAADIERIRLFSEAVHRYEGCIPPKLGNEDLVADRISDWAWGKTLGSFKSSPKSKIPEIGISLAGFIYGFIHLLAWDAPMHSSTQKTMWRMSSTVTLTVGILFVITSALSRDRRAIYHPPKLSRRRIRLVSGLILMSTLCLFSFLMIFIALHVLSRTFLIVQCFVQLAALPEGVYDQTKLSIALPHLN